MHPLPASFMKKRVMIILLPSYGSGVIDDRVECDDIAKCFEI